MRMIKQKKCLILLYDVWLNLNAQKGDVTPE